jgi:outer membrane immunogenic protein
MKRFLLGGAVAIFGTASAFATDLPAKAPIYKATPAYNWTGFYAGVHGGYGFGEDKVFEGTTASSGKIKPEGWFGGGQIGYNSQFAPHWLVGAELDLSGGSIKDRTDFGGGIIETDKINFLGTARTRFGYVQDRSLLYVTGGVAWARAKYQSVVVGVNADVARWDVGWTVGAGYEYAFSDYWSWKIEYLYAGFDKTDDFVGGALGIRRTFDPSLSMVKFGLNYRFAPSTNAHAYMPTKAAAPVSYWDGGYFGAHGGYAWADYHLTDSANDTWNLKPKGGYGGIESGYNWLLNPAWLLGVEIDSSWGDLKENGAGAGGTAGTVKLDNLGTARLRTGYVANNALFYVTGGGAYAREKFTTLGAQSKADHFGWTVGGGIEYKFAPEWSAKLEYFYADLGKDHFNNPVINGTKHEDLTLSTVRVGVNYSGPVIERFFGGR